MAALPRSSAPSRPPVLRRRLGAHAALTLGCLVVAELLAWVAGAVLFKGSDWMAATAREQERAGRDAAVAASAAIGGPTQASRGGETVLHPYLGYVTDPAINRRPERRGALLVDAAGFYATPDDLGGREPGQVDVGIFGGSVAFLLCFEGRDALLQELARVPRFAGRHLAVHCRALGGFKQPQPLLALTYLATLGERYDLVIEIDGFNELALPWAENRPRDVNPFYPRSWDATVGDVVSPARQIALASLAAERSRRRAIASVFAAAVLRRDPLSRLLWLALDRDCDRRIAGAERQLLTAPANPGFLSHGPRFAARGRQQYFAALTRQWAASSREMAALATALGARYYHVLQPNQYVAGSKPMGAAERRLALRGDHPYGAAVATGYSGLADAGRELRRQGVSFLDARFVFRAVAEPLYVDDCCHFGPRGNALFGAWIGSQVATDLGAQPAGVRPRAVAMRRASTAAP